MSNITLIGLDLAKNVFQICGLNRAGKVIFNRKVTRHKLLPSLLDHPQAVVAMEACGSSQYWARELIKQGMRVKLIPARQQNRCAGRAGHCRSLATTEVA